MLVACNIDSVHDEFIKDKLVYFPLCTVNNNNNDNNNNNNNNNNNKIEMWKGNKNLNIRSIWHCTEALHRSESFRITWNSE